MKILFVSHFIPHPPTGGASLRNYNLIRNLARKNRVHLITLTQRVRHPTEAKIEESLKVLRGICADIKVFPIPTDSSRIKWYLLLLLNLFSPKPYSVWRFWNKKMARAIKSAVAEEDFDVVHVDTIDLASYLPYLEGVPNVLNHHNIESSLLNRWSLSVGNPLSRFYLWLQGKKLQNYENSFVRQFDCNVVVSELDKKQLLDSCPTAQAEVVANGTDTEFFRPDPEPTSSPSLVFAGSMAWYPNADAMILFANDIWPLIKQKIPDIQMYLIGSAPPRRVVAVGQEDDAFHVMGFVDDVRPYINRAAAYVVPIRVGGGTRLKIVDAMAMGKAVVSHPIGAEGLQVTDGKDILLASESEAFADKVVSVVQDQQLRRRLEIAAREIAVELYSWEKITPKLMEVYGAVIAKARSSSGQAP